MANRLFRKAAAALTAVWMLLSSAGCATEVPLDELPAETTGTEAPLTAEPEEETEALTPAAETPVEPLPAETEYVETAPAETEPVPAEPEPEPVESEPEPEPSEPETESAQTDPETEATDPKDAEDTEKSADAEPDGKSEGSEPEGEEKSEEQDDPDEEKEPEETNIAGVKMSEVLLLRERDEARKKAEKEAAEKAEKAEQEKKEAARLAAEAAIRNARGTGAYSYFDGITCSPEQQQKRPVAIMLNNLKLQLPQYGLDYGQIFFECVTEGSITRLMMLTTNYESLGTVGSIRSSREIFADFVPDFDAIYVHAGGSPGAYATIMNRGIDSLDGANMYLPSTYFRDQWRLNNIGYEHSLMTNGAGIVSGIQFKGYRTQLRAGFTPTFNFYDENTNNVIGGAAAEHVRVYSTPIQTVDFVYNAWTGQYVRYHYNGIAHVDGNSGTQISVKNVILLFMDIGVIPGDEKSRVAVSNVGTGTGYYMTNGQWRQIAWSRSSSTDSMHYSYADGTPLILNAGKTFVCVVEKSVANSVEFNHQW